MNARYEGRNAVVLGLGLTGLSLARHLAGGGARVRVADTRTAPPHAAALHAELPQVPLTTGAFTAATLDGCDLIAISPGVAKDTPVIRDAVSHGAELVGDIELFARALPPEQKLLAITGSNGKTTVTALTGALTRAAGMTTIVAGNIGDAVLDVLARCESGDTPSWPDVFVLELSSFQLETTSSLHPNAATVLNVTGNHLDRYAGIDDYAAAKRRIFSGASVQVLNRDDPRSLAMHDDGEPLETFGADVPVQENEWGLVARDGHGGDLWLARGGELLVPQAALSLLGRHNALNALAALALTSTVAKISRPVLSALTHFQGLPHRMQRIEEAAGVLFVNDSKGTTTVATEVALEGIGRPVVLIAGGDGKGQDFATLRGPVTAHCRSVLLIGRDAAPIAAVLAGTGVAIECVETLDRAVTRALALAQAGDAIVLSPACASLDQFSSYVERGDRFAQLVSAALEQGAIHA